MIAIGAMSLFMTLAGIARRLGGSSLRLLRVLALALTHCFSSGRQLVVFSRGVMATLAVVMVRAPSLPRRWRSLLGRDSPTGYHVFIDSLAPDEFARLRLVRSSFGATASPSG